MPVVFREGGLSFFFFSNEGVPREPPHVHVRGGGRDAKIWLVPEVSVADSFGFSSKELARILNLATANRAQFLSAWDDYFTGRGSL